MYSQNTVILPYLNAGHLTISKNHQEIHSFPSKQDIQPENTSSSRFNTFDKTDITRYILIVYNLTDNFQKD